jgi:hypothetical protein
MNYNSYEDCFSQDLLGLQTPYSWGPFPLSHSFTVCIFTDTNSGHSCEKAHPSSSLDLDLNDKIIDVYVAGSINIRDEICNHPLVDPYISEPCDTPTTADGYQLSPEGIRVLGCFLVGGGTILSFITGDFMGDIL